MASSSTVISSSTATNESTFVALMTTTFESILTALDSAQALSDTLKCIKFIRESIGDSKDVGELDPLQTDYNELQAEYKELESKLNLDHLQLQVMSCNDKLPISYSAAHREKAIKDSLKDMNAHMETLKDLQVNIVKNMEACKQDFKDAFEVYAEIDQQPVTSYGSTGSTLLRAPAVSPPVASNTETSVTTTLKA